MQVLLATDSLSADTFVRLIASDPSFNKVGTLLAADCWLLLDAPPPQNVEAK